MVVDAGMNLAELLQCLRASKPLHGSHSSSKRLMRILRAIVQPIADLLVIGVADLITHRRGISAEPVGDDRPRSAHFSMIRLRSFGATALSRFAVTTASNNLPSWSTVRQR
jgi:hypothetical protein